MKSGGKLEELVKNSAIREARYYTLEKVDPPVRVMGFGANRRVLFLKNPFLDFVGCWTAGGGRMIACECKETNEPKLAFGSTSGINAQQCENLFRWRNAGGIAFVLWQFEDNVNLLSAAWLREQNDLAAAKQRTRTLHWGEVPKKFMVGAPNPFSLFLHQAIEAQWFAAPATAN